MLTTSPLILPLPRQHKLLLQPPQSVNLLSASVAIMVTEVFTMDKTCSRCGEVKPLTEYHNKKRNNGKPAKCSRCRSCECELKKLRYDPVKKREKDLIARFGMTGQEYEDLLHKQSGACAICGTTEFKYSRGRRPHIDHCHETGKVRGLLCGHCNIGIGQFFDNISLLERAITYLKEHGSVSRTCPTPPLVL